MKIMICGSMRFATQMLDVKKKLEMLGHKVNVPSDIDSHIKNPKLVDDLDQNLIHAKETDIMRECFNIISKSDAILVLNIDKGNLKGYIGISSLMEIAVAAFSKKKIYFYNPLPHRKDQRWVHEVILLDPVIINGNLNLIKG